MAELDWATFLRTWSGQLLDSPLAEGLSADVRASAWLGFPPATDDELADAERRLKIPLPPSYRAFLKVSNGCPCYKNTSRIMIATSTYALPHAPSRKKVVRPAG